VVEHAADLDGAVEHHALQALVAAEIEVHGPLLLRVVPRDFDPVTSPRP